jgi:hypothetical protein
MVALKHSIKKNRLMQFIISQIRELQYVYVPYLLFHLVFNIKKTCRVTGMTRNTRYEKLKMLKSKHFGERCFIIATGPSLTVEDLEKLRKEITFSMNSICLAFEHTDWRPTYYGIQDKGVFNKLERKIAELECECKFIGDTITRRPIGQIEDYYYYPLNLLNHNAIHKKYNTKFSRNPFAVVYDGYSITYSLIQIAVYMGFQEIYLLGADCNYASNTNHHFIEYEHKDPDYLTAGDRMVCAYREAKRFADKNNIKIYNATRGGMLEVFERVELDSFLNNVSDPMISTGAC